jgi:FkbM family methyltransferase
MSLVHSDLIYDIGLFDGGDTAYYLYRGYNVVAVDANPVMVENARLRFVGEVQNKMLTLLNVGISSAPGMATFWISDVPEWSSFDRTIACRDGTGHRSASVPVVPLAHLFEEYGVPHYLKIDIEGNDRVCVEALQGGTLPRYISVESECVGDSAVLSDVEATAMLELLRNVGYQRFKLVNQIKGWTSVRPNAAAHFGMRLLNSAANGRFRVRGFAEFAGRFADSGRIASLGFSFSRGSSGPWGGDVPGGWMPFDKARSTYLRERHAFFAMDRPLYSFWYDWHATY